ncbi:hypothetical protein M9Y10_007380 [Tritrichomonas musculus]|uniref:Calpain catalytic domain-containing protein n=1 Tax=Tritrichomonas musculus TaxID=1915356 RepID=A0ABR2J2G6_9EUKA
MKCKKEYDDFVEEAKKYENVLIKYKNTGEVFVDPNFHPSKKVRENINKRYLKKSKYWKRIDDIYPAPLFQKDLIKPEYVNQGKLCDCYLICALSQIAIHPHLVPLLFDTDTPNRILGCVPNSINIKCGAVVIYFICFGRRTPVLIDTFMPIHRNGTLRFSCPSSRSASPWFCLVEKAFAKLNGSYSNINWGYFEESVYSFFKYYPTVKKISKLNKPPKIDKMSVFDRIMKYYEQGAVMSAGINVYKTKATIRKLKKNKLLYGHCYTILKVKEFEGKRLICIQNPWGGFEWKGDWSKRSNLWTPELRKEFNVTQKENGIFWMDEKDFCKYFTTLRICKPILPNWHCKQFSIEAKPNFHEVTNVLPFLNKKTYYALKVVDEIPNFSECRFRIIVECRIRPIMNSVLVWNKFPLFTIMLAHLNGKKLNWSNFNYSKIKEFDKRDIISSIKFDVNSNDDVITLSLYRSSKSIMVEDFFVTVCSEYNFDLYNIDDPTHLLPEIEKNKSLFDVFSNNDDDDEVVNNNGTTMANN